MTPKKARVKGTIAYLEANNIPHFKERVFRFHRVSYNRGWQILKEDDTVTDNRIPQIFKDCLELEGGMTAH